MAALQLLGLAARAGKVAPGTERAAAAVRTGKARFVVVAADLTPTGRDKLVPLLERERVEYVERFTRARLGDAVGRSPLAAVAVADAGFGHRLAVLLGVERQEG